MSDARAQLRAKRRQVTRTAGLVAITSAMLPAMLLEVKRSPPERADAVRQAWVKRWSRALLSLFAVDVVVVGELPPRSGGRLVVSNHRSAIDIGVLLSVLGGTMVSRADIAQWPLIGQASRAVGTVFVDRKSAESGAATIRIVQKSLEGGSSISIFPEGTTFDGDEVRPFHGGGFVAAIRAEAEVLPVALAYPRSSGVAFVNETFPAHLARLAASDRTRMAIAIGSPIRVTRTDRAAKVSAAARDAVSALVARARAVVGP